LVQKLPPEAWVLEADRCGAVDVLAVGTEEQLEEFLADYRRRLDAACGKDVELEILPVGVDV
jgi:hypothetical protein